MPANRDEKPVALVAEAHAAAQLLWSNPHRSIAEIAKGAVRSLLGSDLPLAWTEQRALLGFS